MAEHNDKAPREVVVRRLIHADISSTADQFAEQLARQVEDGKYTKAEVKDALSGNPDFEEAWECIENDVDDPDA